MPKWDRQGWTQQIREPPQITTLACSWLWTLPPPNSNSLPDLTTSESNRAVFPSRQTKSQEECTRRYRWAAMRRPIQQTDPPTAVSTTTSNTGVSRGWPASVANQIIVRLHAPLTSSQNWTRYLRGEELANRKDFAIWTKTRLTWCCFRRAKARSEAVKSRVVKRVAITIWVLERVRCLCKRPFSSRPKITWAWSWSRWIRRWTAARQGSRVKSTTI